MDKPDIPASTPTQSEEQSYPPILLIAPKIELPTHGSSITDNVFTDVQVGVSPLLHFDCPSAVIRPSSSREYDVSDKITMRIAQRLDDWMSNAVEISPDQGWSRVIDKSADRLVLRLTRRKELHQRTDEETRQDWEDEFGDVISTKALRLVRGRSIAKEHYPGVKSEVDEDPVTEACTVWIIATDLETVDKARSGATFESLKSSLGRSWSIVV